ncbi:MAG: hypothetical protein ACRDSS_15710 [Actinocrinis sp.]
MAPAAIVRDGVDGGPERAEAPRRQDRGASGVRLWLRGQQSPCGRTRGRPCRGWLGVAVASTGTRRRPRTARPLRSGSVPNCSR